MSKYSRSTLRCSSWNSAVEDCFTMVLDTLRGSRELGRPMLKLITLQLKGGIGCSFPKE